jgi:hypothetical protein
MLYSENILTQDISAGKKQLFNQYNQFITVYNMITDITKIFL